MDTHTITDTASYAKIVVPLDGSSLSEAALPLAVTIARASHGTVDLVRVHVPISVAPDAGFSLPDWDDEIRDAERTYLTMAARKLAAESDVPTQAHLLEGGIGRAIEEHVEKVQASLVVITTHGRTGLSRAWLGSTADWLVRFAPVPVLVVRPPDVPSAHAIALKHVLVALDGSERSEKVVADAVRLGRLGGARFTLLRVVAPVARNLASYGAPTLPALTDEERTAEVLRRAKGYLDDVAERIHLDVEGLEISTEVVASERVADAILERARTAGADVVAMSTRGRGASRLLVGSVADKVLRGFTGAMLVLGPVAVRELESDELVDEEEIIALG